MWPLHRPPMARAVVIGGLGTVSALAAVPENASTAGMVAARSATLTGEQRRRLIGIALMIGAVACFACLDATAKWVNRSTDPIQTAAVRYLGSFLLVGAFFNPWTRTRILRTRRPWLQCARALCLVFATVCAFFALSFLRLTEVTSITFAAPLLVALLAGPLLGEQIGARRLTAVLVGFAGVLVVTRPASGGLHPAALLAVAAACANALYSIATRFVAAYDPPETTLLYTGLVGSAVFVPVIPFVWASPSSALGWAAARGARHLRGPRPLVPDPRPQAGAGLGAGAVLLRPAAVGDGAGLPGLRRGAGPLDTDRWRHRHHLGALSGVVRTRADVGSVQSRW